MDNLKLQQAIESDLKAIPSLKFSIVPARHYYGSFFSLVFKISLIFVFISIGLRIFLKIIGLYQAPIDLLLVAISWGVSLFPSLFLAFISGRLLSFGAMIKGQIKSAAFFKRKFIHISLFFFSVYSVLFLVASAICDQCIVDTKDAVHPIYVAMTTGIIQFVGFLFSIISTHFFALAELERVGLAPLFNVIAENMQKDQSNFNQR